MRDQALVDLICKLEQASHEAGAFALVTLDDTGAVVHATGPFDQPEQALAQAGRDEADWREHGEGDIGFIVVPLWEPST